MKQAKSVVRLICTGCLILGTQGIAQLQLLASSPPPKPPSTGTPKGNSTPGTTRPPVGCQPTTKPLTVLNANNGYDFTASVQPSLWFYIPYRQEDIRHAEFILLDAQERTTIYQTTVKLPATPGLNQITLPPESEKFLQPYQNYRWYFMLDCSGSDEPDAVVDGWIQRQVIKIHPVKQSTNKLDQYNFYLKNHLWYDAVNYLAQLHLQYPHDLEIQLTWRDLLNKLDKE